ncbi:short-chain dehydrogenase/reductase family protein [Favolaschia claudopus]|uniref:Short-chain dehydrogenase/reductase family protein n=1 Tax=Favolaschia claudopus TaxID=2862362 RepID=A0AAW0AAM3_9AGAR
MSTVRSILVTGANQGLGMHTVHQLGASKNVLVFMGSRKLAAAEEARAKWESEIDPSSSVVPVQLDITDATSIKNAHDFIEKHLKEKNLTGLDVLINNAALGVPSFADTYAVNVIGTAAITEAIRPLMNNNGAILNISSTLGSLDWHTQRPPPPLFPAYSSSKSALNSLTLQWAIQEEEKKSGIRVISICPGFNATNLNNYTGTMSPSEGCQVMVKAALAKEGKSGVFINKDGDVKW